MAPESLEEVGMTQHVRPGGGKLLLGDAAQMRPASPAHPPKSFGNPSPDALFERVLLQPVL